MHCLGLAQTFSVGNEILQFGFLARAFQRNAATHESDFLVDGFAQGSTGLDLILIVRNFLLQSVDLLGDIADGLITREKLLFAHQNISSLSRFGAYQIRFDATEQVAHQVGVVSPFQLLLHLTAQVGSRDDQHHGDGEYGQHSGVDQIPERSGCLIGHGGYPLRISLMRCFNSETTTGLVKKEFMPASRVDWRSVS